MSVISQFSFKSKTMTNNAARIEVIHHSDGSVIICKIITSKNNPFNFLVIREFCGYLVLMERIALKKESLDIIIQGLNDKIKIE